VSGFLEILIEGLFRWFLEGLFGPPADPGDDGEEIRYHHPDPSLEGHGGNDPDPRDPDLEEYERTP